MKLYHGSPKKIESFDNNRPMWFSARREDSQLAINMWYVDEPAKGYVYEIEVKDFELTTDFMDFHTGEILTKTSAQVVKMESKDVDNNWFVIRNILNFNPKIVASC